MKGTMLLYQIHMEIEAIIEVEAEDADEATKQALDRAPSDILFESILTATSVNDVREIPNTEVVKNGKR